MNALPNPFLDGAPERPIIVPDPQYPRGFDPEKFLIDIEEAPKFLSSPSADYLDGIF